MKLISYRTDDDYNSFGILREDLGGVIDLEKALDIWSTLYDEGIPPIVSLFDLIWFDMARAELLSEVEDMLEDHDLTDALLDTDYELTAPITRPGAIYALGRNYPAHARESGLKPPEEPIVFGKAVTSVIGPNEPVVYKHWLTRVDPEAELALCRRIYLPQRCHRTRCSKNRPCGFKSLAAQQRHRYFLSDRA